MKNNTVRTQYKDTNGSKRFCQYIEFASILNFIIKLWYTYSLLSVLNVFTLTLISNAPIFNLTLYG